VRCKCEALGGKACALAWSVGVVGNRWSLLIVQDALAGKRRFGEFQRNLGIAKNILSARLRKLVERGIFVVAPSADGTAYSEYVLTPKGKELSAVIMALRQWGEEFLAEATRSRAALANRGSTKVLRRKQHLFRSKCGAPAPLMK
jgi:DNA-binding HxlR family transcriptional regulator